MIVIKKEIEDTSCSLKPCSKMGLYKFTDIKIKKSKKKRKIKQITLGYSCMNHIDEVGKLVGRYKIA